MEPRIAYRKDIDGLRAFAVLSVLFCHAGLGLPGGYVGVDIFFVISGFLITSLILKDIQCGTFSLINFWERRIRRILPALVVVTATVVIAGWFFLLPAAYAMLGETVSALILLVSNVRFWRLSGYFAPDSKNLALLHTWSLALEEQFYLLLPLGLATLAKLKRLSNAPLLLSTVAVISFGIAVGGMKMKPDATFYLLPTRIWELISGSLLAFAHPARSRSLRAGMAWLSLPLFDCPVFLVWRRYSVSRISRDSSSFGSRPGDLVRYERRAGTYCQPLADVATDGVRRIDFVLALSVALADSRYDPVRFFG